MNERIQAREGKVRSKADPDLALKRRMRRLRFLPRLKRSLRKQYIRVVHGDDYFVTRYFGAQFIVRWTDIVSREIALKNFEHIQLDYFMRASRRLRPSVFIDIGANSGLYSCILLKNGLVPAALLFEPDRRNAIYLRANLQINGVLDKAVIYDAAIGARAGRMRLAPGPDTNTGTSRIIDDGKAGGTYEVEMVRLSDIVSHTGEILAIKMDIEGHELAALTSMEDVLQRNRGIIQIETTEKRAEVAETMQRLGYTLAADFSSDLVFEK
jgi:FkbM family methyltransferase